MIAFGPVPSRRLGNSLGLNNIPYKFCSYSCVYCQVGRTRNFATERREFYDGEEIFAEAEEKVRSAEDRGERIDYLTFVPDGEPTLDANLGRTIELLQPLGVKIAVITNASLMGNPEVRSDLQKADWVSLKFDSVIEETWRKINRPHRSLRLGEIMEGAEEFASVYGGTLVTETMLVAGVNEGEESVRKTADFIARLGASVNFLSVPTRPPAERRVERPSEADLIRAYGIFSDGPAEVEYLIGYEGNAFSSTGDIERDLLSITAVHPMRTEAVGALLRKTNSHWSAVARLIDLGLIAEVAYGEQTFLLRRFSANRDPEDGYRVAP